MSRRIGLPVRVEVNAAGEPVSFTWRGRAYAVEVIGCRHPRDRRCDPERHSDRKYYRLLTPDHEVFEVYREHTSAGPWVLDVGRTEPT